MQTISGIIMRTYDKLVGQITAKTNKKVKNEKFLTKEIIENLKQAEKQIQNGEGIFLDDFVKEVRVKYEYKEI